MLNFLKEGNYRKLRHSRQCLVRTKSRSSQQVPGGVAKVVLVKDKHGENLCLTFAARPDRTIVTSHIVGHSEHDDVVTVETENSTYVLTLL